MTINGAKVEKADIEASNGIIHIMEETIDPIPTGNIAEVVSTDPRWVHTVQYDSTEEDREMKGGGGGRQWEGEREGGEGRELPRSSPPTTGVHYCTRLREGMKWERWRGREECKGNRESMG